MTIDGLPAYVGEHLAMGAVLKIVFHIRWLQGRKTANKSSSIKIQKSVEPPKMFQLHQIFFQLIDINHNNDTKSWICNRLSFSKDKGVKMMKIMGKISIFWFLSMRKAHLASRKHAETC